MFIHRHSKKYFSGRIYLQWCSRKLNCVNGNEMWLCMHIEMWFILFLWRDFLYFGFLGEKLYPSLLAKEECKILFDVFICVWFICSLRWIFLNCGKRICTLYRVVLRLKTILVLHSIVLLKFAHVIAWIMFSKAQLKFVLIVSPSCLKKKPEPSSKLWQIPPFFGVNTCILPALRLFGKAVSIAIYAAFCVQRVYAYLVCRWFVVL